MKIRPSWWRRGFTLSLFVGGLLSSGACGIREDEFDCENAVARLAQCCPGFDATSVDCTYSPGCGNAYPALDPSQSNCILQSSCDSLRNAGVCEAAANLTQGSATELTTPMVCPPGPPDDASTEAGPGPDGPTIDLTCRGPSGCEAGETCCALVSQSSGEIAAISLCTAHCPSDGFVLCGSSQDCAGGLSCVAPAIAASYGVMVCSPPADAAAEASTEASIEGSDSSLDATTDQAPEAAQDAVPATPEAAAADAGVDASGDP
jgi:hypothetical protein